MYCSVSLSLRLRHAVSHFIMNDVLMNEIRYTFIDESTHGSLFETTKMIFFRSYLRQDGLLHEQHVVVAAAAGSYC